MRPGRLTVTGVANSNVFIPCHYLGPFNVALGLDVVGTHDVTVQYTFDDVFAPTFSAATADWRNHASLTNKTADTDSSIAYPVTGIRLVGNSGTGTSTLTIIQAGGGYGN